MGRPKCCHPLKEFRISLVIRQSFFYFQNNPKNLDPSYKMDLDLWDCLGRVKVVLQQHFIGLIKLFVFSLDRGNPVLLSLDVGGGGL